MHIKNRTLNGARILSSGAKGLILIAALYLSTFNYGPFLSSAYVCPLFKRTFMADFIVVCTPTGV